MCDHIDLIRTTENPNTFLNLFEGTVRPPDQAVFDYLIRVQSTVILTTISLGCLQHTTVQRQHTNENQFPEEGK